MSLESALYKQEEQDHEIDHVLDRELIRISKPALTNAESVKGSFSISNQDRSTGTMLSNEIKSVFSARASCRYIALQIQRNSRTKFWSVCNQRRDV
jgi:Glutamate synthase domain 3